MKNESSSLMVAVIRMNGAQKRKIWISEPVSSSSLIKSSRIRTLF